jgi:ADP-heptose:LPS heptosyltransferase
MSMFNRTALLRFADATIGSWLCWILGAVNHMTRGDTPTAPVATDKVKRILIIRPGGMGDMIILLPVIRLLKEKYPGSAIDIVCEKRNAGVLNLAGMAEQALIYDINPLGFLFHLRSRGYDVAVDTEQFHHFSAVFALLSKAPVRIGFKINPKRNPLYTHLINYAPDGPEGEQFMRLIEPLGVTNTCYDIEDALPALKTEMTPDTREQVARASGSGGFAAMHTGSASRLKLWAPENYIKLAGRLQQERQLGVVLVGGRDEKRVNAGIAEGAGNKAVSLAGGLDLEATAAVIKQARVFIGPDSGLAHLAVALGVPTVVLFGPSDHLKWGIEDHSHAVVRSDLPCAPCFIFGYHKPCRNIACMKQISAEAVSEAVGKVM